jgi:hypothetical protein
LLHDKIPLSFKFENNKKTKKINENEEDLIFENDLKHSRSWNFYGVLKNYLGNQQFNY